MGAALSQHLKVLREAGLVSERRVGRLRIYRLTAQPLSDVGNWLARYGRFWDERFDRLILGAGFLTMYRRKPPDYLAGCEVKPEAEDRGPIGALLARLFTPITRR